MNTYRNHGLKAEIEKRKEIQPRKNQVSKEGVHEFDFGDIAVIQMSADLRKESFRHFSSFCVIKISKTSIFKILHDLTRLKLLLTCNTIKGAKSSDKIK